MATALLESLSRANLLPSLIIPSDFNPIINLDVHFPTKSVTNGTLVRVSEVKEAPTICISVSPSSSSSGNDDDGASAPATTTLQQKLYTFMLIDPDAPTPDDPKFGYWRHWVVTSIPGPSSALESSSSDAVRTGRTLTQYLAPGPKDESGPHRYRVLLFLEPEGLRLEKDDVGGEEFVDRRSFRAEELVEKYGLRLAGVQWMTGVGDGWKGKES
jgi:phosphatidylethanolamine-binding protein (PEBP) family uncharacterized protein